VNRHYLECQEKNKAQLKLYVVLCITQGIMWSYKWLLSARYYRSCIQYICKHTNKYQLEIHSLLSLSYIVDNLLFMHTC